MKRNPDNPSTLLFWNDLEGEQGLKFCGIAGLGLWVKMLSLAARSREYGVVLVGDHPSRREELPALLASACSETVETIADLIDNLIMFKVASVDDQGRVYNRRMVAEAMLSAARSEAGRRGATSTNRKRQTSGKVVGKQGGNANGKGSSNPGSNQPDLSASQQGEKTRKTTGRGRQNDGNSPDKSSPSSLFMHSSVPTGTGAKAPRSAGENDAQREVFTTWLAWLIERTGKAEPQCRQLLGKWRNALGDDGLIEVLEACEGKRPTISDPVSWVEAAIKTRGQRAAERSTRSDWARGLP
jgi:hypothetical protein